MFRQKRRLGYVGKCVRMVSPGEEAGYRVRASPWEAGPSRSGVLEQVGERSWVRRSTDEVSGKPGFKQKH